MTSHGFGAFLEHEDFPPRKVEVPASAFLTCPSSSTRLPMQYELDSLQWGTKLNGPSKSRNSPSEASQTRDPEHSPPATSIQNSTTDMIQSLSSPPMNRWRFAATALMFFTNGMNDSAPGALIPYMESRYEIGYAVVSLIFVTNAVGFLSAAPSVQAIESRLGRARTYILSVALMCGAYVALVCNPPFPVVVLSFLLIGFGEATVLAMSTVFSVNLVNGTVMLGYLQGAYGVGGIVAPLAATAMVSKGVSWEYFYFIPLALTLVNIAFAGWSFWNYEKESHLQPLATPEQIASRQATGQQQASKGSSLKSAFRNRTTFLGAILIFAYQGAEVSISGWVISFLIDYRDGDPSHVGYVTSGFWAGITVGRFLLTHPVHKIGDRVSVLGLTIGAISCQLLVWLLPNVIGDAVGVALIGLLLGPVCPVGTSYCSRLLPRAIQMTSLSIIASMGSSGGAAAPFFTGLLAQKAGTVVLHPICIGLFVVMGISWMLLPKLDKRTE